MTFEESALWLDLKTASTIATSIGHAKLGYGSTILFSLDNTTTSLLF